MCLLPETSRHSRRRLTGHKFLEALGFKSACSQGKHKKQPMMCSPATWVFPQRIHFCSIVYMSSLNGRILCSNFQYAHKQKKNTCNTLFARPFLTYAIEKNWCDILHNFCKTIDDSGVSRYNATGGTKILPKGTEICRK